MKSLKVEAIVIEEFNDSKNSNRRVEKGTILELDSERYELLKSKGKVEEYRKTIKPLIKRENEE
jgi:hypothetical protein